MESPANTVNSHHHHHLEPPVSKLVHVRNLPPDCNEQDLHTLASSFGRVESVLLIKGKNQGLIQFQDQIMATRLVEYYRNFQASVRGRSVYFTYSKREEISTNKVPESQNSILLVTILNVLYPITCDILYEVFSVYGTILKIVIFEKNGLQSFIQYSDVQSAVNAKMALNGQNIYGGCCTLLIQFSTVKNLEVKYNTDKSRDYTILPIEQSGSVPQPRGFSNYTNLLSQNSAFQFNNHLMWPQGYFGSGGNNFSGFNGNSLENQQSISSASSSSREVSSSSVLIVSNLDPERISCDILFNLFSVYGIVTRIKILYNKKDTALIQFSNPQYCETALLHLSGCPLYGKNMKVSISKHTYVPLPRPGTEQENSNLTKDYSQSSMNRFKSSSSKISHHISPPSITLHISNIPLKTSEETLREIFGQYAAVKEFKFFPKKEADKKRMALIQFESISDSVNCLVHLHNQKISDSIEERNIQVSFSNKLNIK